MQDGNFKVCPVWFLMICLINCYDHVLVTHQQDHHQRNNYSQSQHYRRRKLDVKERLQFKEFSQKVMMETWRETGGSLLSSPSVHSRFHYPDQAAITADYLVFKMIYICYTRQDFERRAPRKNLGLMVKNFNSCRTCGKHSHNLQNLYHWIRSTHDTTVRSPSCSSINHWQMDWIGWQMFRISGCYFQCWRTANLCGILWRE